MQVGLYMSAAGLQAQELRQAVTANNLANTQTTGFKRDMAVIQSRLNAFRESSSLAPYRFQAPQPLLNQGGGVGLMPAQIDLSQGSLQQTGNQTDLALEGRGFFQLQDPQGNTTLTRDGHFLINRDGTLVSANNNYAVLSASGSPIRLNPNYPVAVTADGQLSQTGDGSVSVQIAIKTVADPTKLVKLGQNLLTTQNPSDITDAAETTLVRQGALETSSADPVVEMVNMIENQRSFEANARMISYQDQTMQQLNTIGRVA